MNQDLEALIQDHAQMMAEQLVSAAEWARSEEEVRQACDRLIDEFVKKAGLAVKGRHEYGLAGGRIDSKYGGVVIEYKLPKGSARLTPDRNAPGVKAVVDQVKRRFQDLYTEEHVPPDRIFGVGCDGKMLVFVRQRGKTPDVEEPQPVTAHTVERMLRAMVSLGARGLAFTPENLADHFGSGSKSAQEGVRQIHALIHGTKNPKARTLFDQWKILFGEVCGYDIHARNTKIGKLAENYATPDPNPAELLFAVHTYYALFIKLLAAEIVSSFSPLGTSPLKKLVSAPTPEKLRDELRTVERGGIWTQLGIRNFLEGDLFSWYLDAWDDRIVAAIRAMTLALYEFDPSTLSVDPAESRDLLKQLYQELFPKSVRHDLGEYYTPDWLAELVLDEVGYNGNPDKRLLDPACGSGTFLVMAINRVKSWYKEHHLESGLGEDELLRKILSNVVGFDLNPLAVMAARTNYLMAIRDLLRHADNIELPIYLCDSIMTPSEYGDLFTGQLGNARQLKTSAGDFNIPTEVAENRDHIGHYADMLEACIRHRYSPSEFLERCKAEAIPVTEAALHKKLYGDLQQLDADNRNGVWARIIKNAFAPLFIEQVDYVVGNPPWITWANLPESYRTDTSHIWQRYDLFRHKGLRARLGSSGDDLSILMTYVSADRFLGAAGRIGLVITQSLFQSAGGGEGFRRFRVAEGKNILPIVVHDLVDLKPFEAATNRTAVLIAMMSQDEVTYPVRYVQWTRISKGRLPSESSLLDIGLLTKREVLEASPSGTSADSAWCVLQPNAVSALERVMHPASYSARKGISTSANGVFWLEVLERVGGEKVVVRNMHAVGKKEVPLLETVLESSLVAPLVRGRDLQRWRIAPSAYIVTGQDPADPARAMSEATLKRGYPLGWEYFLHFREILERRRDYQKYFAPQGQPFYSLYNFGRYTLSPHKVVWREIDSDFRCAVLSPYQDCELDRECIPLPDHKLVLVPFEELDAAHYACALLNTSIARYVVRSHVVGTQISTHVMKNIAIPLFDKQDGDHMELSSLSKRCHAAAEKSNETRTAELESEIDAVAAVIWGISGAELRSIKKALAGM